MRFAVEYQAKYSKPVRLADDFRDFVQTQAGRCVASDDLRLEK